MEDGYEGMNSFYVGVGVKPEPASIGLFRCGVCMGSTLNTALYLDLFCLLSIYVDLCSVVLTLRGGGGFRGVT